MLRLDAKTFRGERYLSTTAPLGFDLEAAGGNVGHAQEQGSYVLCAAWDAPTQEGRAAEWIGEAGLPPALRAHIKRSDLLIAHGANYEAHWMLASGLDPADFLWWDTLLAEWVLLGNNPRKLSLSLDDTAQRYGLRAKTPLYDHLITKGCVADMPRHWTMDRCTEDVQMTMDLFRAQLALAVERKQLHLIAMRCLRMPVLVHMERYGMYLRQQETDVEYRKVLEEMGRLQADLREVQGGDTRGVREAVCIIYGELPADPTDAEKELAAKSLGFPVIDRNKPTKAFPQGVPAKNAEVLAQLAAKAKTDRQRQWCRLYAELALVKSLHDKNLALYHDIAQDDPPRLRYRIQQGITSTHRDSAVGVRRVCRDGVDRGAQIQNIPHDLQCLMRATAPGSDRRTWNIDASQLEFRGAAVVCKDAVALADIRDPTFDAHIQSLAAKKAKKLPSDGSRPAGYLELLKNHDKEDRRKAKKITFKPLFGGSYSDDPREAAYFEWFKLRYKGIAKAQERWIRSAEDRGYVDLPTGMRFFYPRSALSYTAISNHPIQYISTGELAPIAVMLSFYLLRKARLEAGISVTIHDSAAGWTTPDDEPRVRRRVSWCFTRGVFRYLKCIYGFTWNAPIGAEYYCGDFFGDGESHITEYDPCPNS